MMKVYVLFISFFIGTISSYAQTTAIPDINFEQILINEGIDSDNTINGQVLTSDIITVTNLNLRFVQDLTGLQDFVALESLTLDEGGGNWNQSVTVDLTANTNLEKVKISSFEGLSTLDLTGLSSLEELQITEWQEDVITMEIDSLDLSTNTNINYLELGTEYLQHLNLQNGNNVNMSGFELNGRFYHPNWSMCIKVDDATAATANNAPYSSWIISGIAPTFYETGVCTLSINDLETAAVALYPNPVQSEFQLKSPVAITGIEVFSMRGKQVAQFSSQERYDVSHLSAGMYFLKVATPNRTQVMRLVKK